MPTLQIKAQMTTQQLLKAVEQMPREELDRFVEQIVMLRANQRARKLSRIESELMEKINRGLAEQDQQQLDDLMTRLEARDLTNDENAEYLRLAKLAEALNVERMSALAELARLRRSTIRDVMDELGIKTPVNV